MKKINNNFYNTGLQKFANANRKSMTKAEACLWKYMLSGRKMLGCQFRRQRPVLTYIADFMCLELKLIIEVDGLTHQWEEVSSNDVIRQQNLENIGFKVLRFSDSDVLKDLENVRRCIESIIIDIQNSRKKQI